MAGRDLRALFSTNDRGLSTAEAFTNRERQWELVAAALGEHLQRTADASFDVEDLEAPRDNVTVFHGVGGVGKTTLSRKLELSLASAEHRPAQWGEPTWAGERVLPIRIDLSRAAGTDFERVVLAIRLALAGAVGRPLPAFDLALRRYWEHNHPGESLEEYVRRSGLRGKFAELLPQQMQAAVGEVVGALELPGFVGAAVGQVTGAVVRALRERRQTVRALAGCLRLADLLEAEPDLDALSYYPHLLAWELARLPPKKRVVPVILFDTFEDIGDRTHRDFERLLQRVVWLMPNALFIISGRARLQWADEGLQGQLDFTGPLAWPGLAARDIPPAHTAAVGGRQVLVGDFAPEDCDDYLARRLSRDGQPLISPDIRAVITARSHGLPLHLDLAISRFLELRRAGRTPTADDFDHAFGALIARTLSDLTADERHVLRSVALLDAFDLTLATRAAGLAHQAAAQRLSERPLVDENPYGLWPYSLHGAIRTAIRTAADHTDDRWTTADWTRAAERAFAALGDQWTSTLAPSRILLIGCLRQGLRLARDHRLGLGWLAEAAWAYVGDSIWEPLAPPTPDEPDSSGMHTAADALVELLSALARRQHEHRERTADRLAAVIGTGLLPDELTEMATYYLAKAQRDLGRSDASRTGMQYVAAGGGRLAPAARRGLAHLARLAGDFPTALDTTRTLGWEGRHHRVLGDIWWTQGAMDHATAAYEAARAEAEQHGIAGERATAQAQLAFVTAFTDPTRADDELDLAHHLLSGLDLRATTLTTKIAALIRDAGTTTDLDTRAHLLRTEISVGGLASAEATLELGLAFHHAILDAGDALDAALARLEELTQGGDYAYYTDIVYFMADRSIPARPGPPARWLDGEDVTRDRWRSLVTARRGGTR
ncbi:ATP/GTP-binding protein [Streptomyces roseoverticillatus]|uniref:ATP/GTP-binding protein n=1 Tax=Streptomyces roseoverticillatus TaxID=66429 RepID=UPI001F3839BC|nr:ATP/GTP-binding protein [Streptomyces roseoverticillatus]MCF3105453.1 ATP/GTP-binding protein [Streptomyces roseoverticillatus]